MHNQYLEGTSQQTKSTKQKHPGRNNTSCFTLEYQHKWNKLYIPVGEEKNQTNYKKRKVELHPYSILHLSWNNNYDNTTLITFQRVNTSAEWIKKEKSKKVSWQPERYRSRVIVQWAVKRLLPPTSDRQSVPTSARMPEHAVYPSNGHNLTSLHKTDKKKNKQNQRKKKKKSFYVQDHHLQTLIILVGSFIYLYIYIFIYIYRGVYGRYIHLLQSQYNYK